VLTIDANQSLVYASKSGRTDLHQIDVDCKPNHYQPERNSKIMSKPNSFQSDYQSLVISSPNFNGYATNEINIKD
jgi:hypothetical protein